MTVTVIGRDEHGNPEVSCSWFQEVKPRSASWPPEALELAAG